MTVRIISRPLETFQASVPKSLLKSIELIITQLQDDCRQICNTSSSNSLGRRRCRIAVSDYYIANWSIYDNDVFHYQSTAPLLDETVRG